MGRVCHLVLLAALAPSAGCWLSHGREAEPVAPSPADAGAPPVDAAAPPPLRCEPVRAALSCLDALPIAADVPFSLPFALDAGCGCCPETECRVTVDRAARTLAIETTLCGDRCDCDACNAPRGSCEVPGLEAGEWQVVADGAPAFVLPVGAAGTEPACATYAGRDACAPSTPLPGAAIDPALVCTDHARSERGLDRIVVRHACWPCAALPGACIARLVPRTTRDSRAGGDLHLEPATYTTGCDVGCFTSCVSAEMECYVPPLEIGATYRVFVGGVLLDQFVGGDAAIDCNEILD